MDKSGNGPHGVVQMFDYRNIAGIEGAKSAIVAVRALPLPLLPLPLLSGLVCRGHGGGKD